MTGLSLYIYITNVDDFYHSHLSTYSHGLDDCHNIEATSTPHYHSV